MGGQNPAARVIMWAVWTIGLIALFVKNWGETSSYVQANVTTEKA
jgi:hypothetical protein